MNFAMTDLYPAFPEIFLLVMACVILIADLLQKEESRKATFMMAQFTLLGCLLITWMTLDGQRVLAFNGMFVDDLLADFLKLMTYLAVSVVFFYARRYISQREMARGEFYVLGLFATLGMMVMISANHFVSLYLGLELMSLSLYAMVALQRDSARATEAAMKYFILGALASGMLLYGMSMLYGATNTLAIPELAERLAAGEVNHTVLVFGLVFLVAGLSFKLGVVPFHMWVPDVYHGSPTSATLFISSAPKLAAFAIVVRLLIEGLEVLAADWQGMLVFLAVLSLAVGNLAAIAQTNIKRMLAYSAISHMGFMLLGLISGVVGGDPYNALNAYSSSLFYMVVYVLMSLGGFGMVALLSRAGFEADSLDDFKGLNKRSPWFAAMMAILMFSMAGVPPFVGFFAKFAILEAVIAAGYLWLAIYAVMASLVGAFYYLRVVKIMYFDAPVDTAPIEAGADMRIVLTANGLLVALLGLLPHTLMAICAAVMIHSL